MWIAEKYPNCKVHAMSNSASQRAYIEGRCAAKGWTNVTVTTCDINTYAPPPGVVFDRIVSVEMMEHVKNHRKLFARIADWLASDGKLFVHIFTHAFHPYHFEVCNPNRRSSP